MACDTGAALTTTGPTHSKRKESGGTRETRSASTETEGRPRLKAQRSQPRPSRHTPPQRSAGRPTPVEDDTDGAQPCTPSTQNRPWIFPAREAESGRRSAVAGDKNGAHWRSFGRRGRDLQWSWWPKPGVSLYSWGSGGDDRTQQQREGGQQRDRGDQKR